MATRSDQEAEKVEEITDLVEKALGELAHSECPYCQSYIGLDQYLDRSDIKKWVKEEEETKWQ